MALDRYGHRFPILGGTLVDGVERTYQDAIANHSRPVRGLAVLDLAAANDASTV